ncbi:MFS transporter [Mycobacterium palustre]|uniref:MFS transporter n=1 Tax=Mycobacterium palustre TaxID=153971 RepID=A0A1X1ZQS2_9MYCO|nr:MFS transporter [Mycobacterium palustre]MCV7103054.1 MFS transporter [Mycobacterium palustre]ORW25693.1 MFS transporter [Mycobacterium palustre]
MTTAAPRSPGGSRRARPGRGGLQNRGNLGGTSQHGNPWNALWAMMIGFFMIMVDSTIVAIANPTLKAGLHAGYDAVVWVTSAYLLGYAVVLLVAGRLGDRFGPRNLYLLGLVIFTAASLWCGLCGSVAMLIAARVVQGIGAGVLTPQTLSVITRTFPAQRRGVAASVWGATAGVATLVGPLAGGALVDALGWQWIFFINIPIGIIGVALAVWLIPALPTQMHRLDLVGVALSGVGTFLIVFGLQQGPAAHWQPWIWALIVAGVGFMYAFASWQAVNRNEPLIPLNIFRDRDFTVCNVGVAVVSFAATAMMVPLPFYAQAVCGLSPTRSALLIAPMAVASGVLAPFAGRTVDRCHPGPVLGLGFSLLATGLTWLALEMAPGTPIWRLVLPFVVIGAGMAFAWSPLTATASRNLPPRLAGAGSAVYNSVRQLGAVLGSAGMAAFMTSRIGAEMPAQRPGESADEAGVVVQLPEFLREPFSAAMSQSVLLPAFIALFGIIAALWLLGFPRAALPGGGIPDDGDVADVYGDDDDYVELLLAREPEDQSAPVTAPAPEPVARPRPPRPDPWRGPLGDRVSPGAPIGFAHNGFHIDAGKRLRPVAGPSARHRHRSDPDDDPSSYGRHSR